MNASGKSGSVWRTSIFGSIAAAVLVASALVAVGQPPKVFDEFSGKALSLLDGDTLRVQAGEAKAYFVVQLAGIATPEKKQPYYREAKEALSEMVLNKVVNVKVVGKDRSGRSLGLISIDGKDVNAALVEKGLAWHDPKQNKDEKLAKLAETAKKEKRGLWADANPVAPWDFRKQQAANDTDPKETKPAASTSTTKASYWLNVKTNVRHNDKCEHFGKTGDGRACTKDEGKPCGKCGG